MIQKRHAQVLEIILAHPEGLKSKEILKELDKDTGSHIVDEKELSAVIYSMRNTGLLTASIAKGVNKYFITPRGRNDLEDFNTMGPGVVGANDAAEELTAAQDTGDSEPKEFVEMIGELMKGVTAFCNGAMILAEEKKAAEKERDALKLESSTLRAEIDKLAAEVEMLKGKLSVERKDVKLATLQKLHNIMSEDIAVVLADVASDIENREAA